MKHLYFFLILLSAISLCSCGGGDDDDYMDNSQESIMGGNEPFIWYSSSATNVFTGKSDRVYGEIEVPAEGGSYNLMCSNYGDFTFQQDDWADSVTPYELHFMHLHATIKGNSLTVEVSPLTDEEKTAGYHKFYPFTVKNSKAYFVFSFSQKSN